MKYGFEEKIRSILEEIKSHDPKHHFGRAFLAAYAIAIEFAHRYPDIVEQLGYQVGGAGVGQQTSLSQYIARELSGRIKDGSIEDIEGAFFSDFKQQSLTFNNYGKPLASSLSGTGIGLSMFRLRD